jgi:adenylate kinase family enzyme
MAVIQIAAQVIDREAPLPLGTRLSPMQRILVIGSAGSGKSTLSRYLGEKLSIPVIHLDRIYWKPEWVEPGKEEWLERVRDVISEESWIIDGNYSGTLAVRLEACDTIVFLDMSRLTCLWRVLYRALRYHGRSRPDMATGCVERLDIAFLLWIWHYPYRTRPKVVSLLEAYGLTRKVIHLRTHREVKLFVDGLAAA